MRTRVGTLSSTALLLSSCGGWYNPFAGVGRFISVAVLIVNLVMAYDIVDSDRSSAVKIFWLAIVFLLPILGAAIYLVVGRKQ